MSADHKIAVVLPCYRSKEHVLSVIERIGSEVDKIIVVDDNCPEQTGKYVESTSPDARVHVIYHETNQGVGGAVITGYFHALDSGADIVVKIDSDGQMDPAFIPILVAPLVNGVADYSKGNRFFNPRDASKMPVVRLLGNLALSFMTKASSGYWNLFDPTNGFTAIHRSALSLLPLKNINKRFFFESDMLYYLNLMRAVVVDVPMKAFYGDESSNLSARRAVFHFSLCHSKNIIKRIIYSYFLRDFSPASINLAFGMVLTAFGLIYGGLAWYHSAVTGQPATAGTVMLGALPIIVGVQSLVSFLAYDYAAIPRVPIQRLIN